MVVMRGKTTFNLTLEVPPIPCVERAVATRQYFSQGLAKGETKVFNDHWTTFSNLPYWTYNFFGSQVKCGEDDELDYEALEMLPGSARLLTLSIRTTIICYVER